ncbi:MAG: chromosomal replication initiator protein DnaA [Thermoanaerobaculia bacterium]|nr:chromosomal replication initiator protein DnaA [Thermoanaerobaculia bacterium]
MQPAFWNELRNRLETTLDAEEFSTWIQPLEVARADNRQLVLQAPNEHFVHTLEQSYRPKMMKALSTMDSGRSIDVSFTVRDDRGAMRSNDVSFRRRHRSGNGRKGYGAAHGMDDDRVGAGSRDIDSTGTIRVGDGESPPGGRKFDPRYTFDSFVVGSSNQFCHAAARAVAESPSSSYNPLFLYGGVGLGKTHLMHAIGHAIVADHPNLRVLYIPTEQFVNELISSIRRDQMHAFRERYRTIDVLLIDDIQFIANKERTQEEFFHTFNTLYTAQKQIILSSDSPPRSIPTLEERLRSRFEWGLIADIQPPEFETKIAILQRKAEEEEIDLPRDVADFIAHNSKTNIRELEGMLNRVIAFSQLSGRAVSLELTKETLKDILPQGKTVSPAEIIKFVARHYGLKVSEIKSKNNSKHIAFPRQVAMYLCKQLTQMSYPDIGKQFNGKHHSTVIYSVEKIEELRGKETEIDGTIQSLVEHFR